ncbi:MAG TPA: thiamine pyrophosphate-dependent enzyme, partial [Methylomirabilota bacterium]|nr:thiamine pyrophosphate-dependent enzyme [Methylomirabilota bacterium]
GQVKKAARSVLRARRAVLYVGGGVIAADGAAELLELAELTRIPVTTTLMALGAFPSDHALSLGMLGMHGGYAANMAVYNSDCLIAVGARFDDRVTGKVEQFAPQAEIIHVDIDPSSISKNIKVHIPIVGDARRVLARLIEALREEGAGQSQSAIREAREQWLRQIAQWQQKHPFRYDWDDELIKPQYVVEEIAHLTRGEAVIVTGVGQHQMWAAQFSRFRHPRHWLTSGGLGTMGYGLPAAIGAQVARPDRLVVLVDGDGSFVMNSQELATVVENQLPVKVVIVNNGGHGMVRQWQDVIYGGRFQSIDLSASPDFVKLAEAYGAVGIRASKPNEVVPALERAFAEPGPVVVDVMVDRDELCFPMVPAGGANKDMILERPNKDVKAKAAKVQTGF